MSNTPRSQKHEDARSTLSVDLQSVFDQFVEDYKFAGTIHHGSPFISYIILAEMVKAGWRPTGEPSGIWRNNRSSGPGLKDH